MNWQGYYIVSIKCFVIKETACCIKDVGVPAIRVNKNWKQAPDNFFLFPSHKNVLNKVLEHAICSISYLCFFLSA